MSQFISQVADFLQHKFQHELHEVAIVFPGMRPGRKLLAELEKRQNSIQWAPSIFSLEGLMFELYGMPPSDEILLLHTLYEVFYPEPAFASETFSQFLSKGRMLLRDFDELDRYLLEAPDLFQILINEKEIEARFSLQQDPELVEALRHFMGGLTQGKSDESRELVHFWQQLPIRYTQFKERLRDRNLAYTGMIYRDLAERLPDINPLSAYRHVVLAGFNALSTGEEAFFEYWQKEGKAWFCWDADRYFLDDTSQEAGTFLRQYIQRFPPAIPYADQLGTYHRSRPEPASSKTIQLVGLPLHQSMARFLPELLKQIPPEQHKETAIVLPDEQLSYAVMQSMETGTYNVTMGYPVKQSKAAHYVQLLMNFWRYQDGDALIASSSARDFLLHPWTSAYMMQNDAEAALQSLLQWSKPPILEDPQHLLVRPLPPGSGTPDTELGLRLLKLLKQLPEELLSTPDKALIQELEPALSRLSNLVHQSTFQPPLTEWLRLLPELLDDRKLAFETEEEGLQVCGLLETRGLQFRNLIVLSMNEGIVPRSGSAVSFLPYSLRKAVGLPTADERAGLSAYYLLRLIGGADQTSLLYNVVAESSKAEEPSRFIGQLQEESWFKFRHLFGQLPVNMASIKAIEVPRTEEVKEKLLPFLTGKKAFTPKHLNEWLDCKLKFWWSSVLRVPELEADLPQADTRFLGNALHYVMEKLYENRSDVIQAEELSDDELKQKVEEAFMAVYRSECDNVDSGFTFDGEFRLLQAVCVKFARNCLTLDQKEQDLQVLEVEKAFRYRYPIEGLEQSVLLGGKADRVQKQLGKDWIVDYKTGKSEKAQDDLEKMFEREQPGRPHYALQTLWYAWLQLEDRTEATEAGAKVIYMREEKSQAPTIITYPGFTRADHDGKLAMFKSKVETVIREILLEETPFTQCKDEAICVNCSYNSVCRRG